MKIPKKSYIFSIIFAIFALVCLLIFTYSQKQGMIKEQQTIPNLTINCIDGSLLRITQKDTLNRIIVLFGSDCDFCQDEAKEIFKNHKLLDKWQIIMISSNSIEDLKKFASTYHLDNLPSIKIGYLSKPEIIKKFGSIGVPFHFVYDKNGYQTKRIGGEAKIDFLIK